MLKIPYNFYIEGYNDLRKLLSARSFIGSKDITRDNKVYFSFINPSSNYKLLISKSLFDNEDKLIFKKRIDWDKKDVIYEESKTDEILDDLPF